MTMKYDVLIIGTGQAGPTVAGGFAEAGFKTAVVERDRFGGSCVNYGCTPTKTMVASAHAAYMARRASDFGVVLEGSVSVDMKRVRARKDAVVKDSNEGLGKWLEGADNITVYRGDARFEDTHRVRVGDDLAEGKRIFINVGMQPRVPDIPGIKDIHVLTSNDMVDLDFVPKHLVIIGGSYVGLEFGQMFRRFGSDVTIVERKPRVISHEDEDVSEAVKEILEREGVRFQLEAECISLAVSGDGVEVGVDCENEEAVVGSHVLMAVGREPNTGGLGLENTDITVDDRGFIQVNEELQTTARNVWALGDVNGKGAFTHTSYNDGQIVIHNLLHGESRRVSDRIITYGLFVDPPLGRVGMTEAQARESKRRVLVGKRPMTHVSRAVEKGETQGFMKVMVDADSHEILGAAILGVGGDEAIHCITDAMYARAPYTVLQHAVHIHPTVAELIPTVLGSLEPLE